MFWKENLLNRLSEKTLDDINSFQYQIDGQWHDAEFTKDGAVTGKYQLTVTIPENVGGTITGIRLSDTEAVIGEKSEYIIKKTGKALILKVKFDVKEA